MHENLEALSRAPWSADVESLRTAATRRLPLIIAVFFLIANLAALAWTGVRSGFDTARYTAAAANLLAGRPLVNLQLAYPGYVLVVAICQFVGVGLSGVIAIQLAAAAAAIAIVFRLGSALSGARAGAIAMILLACDPATNRWHAFLLTQTLYMSALIVAGWPPHPAAESPGRDWRH